jgi:hypothetical protein
MIEPVVRNLTFDVRMGLIYAFKIRGSNGNFLDFNGFRIECDIRKSFGATPIIRMNSAADGLIKVWPQNSQIVVIALGINETDVEPGEYLFDVVAVPADGLPIKLMKGKVIVNPTITRVND